MNWDDPVERAALIERVGPEEYNRQFRAHQEASVLGIFNGYKIRPVGSRFGQLFQIDGTNVAFKTLDEAVEHAHKLVPPIKGGGFADGVQPDPAAAKLVSECAEALERFGDYELGIL